MVKSLCNKKVFFKIALCVFCFTLSKNVWAQALETKLNKWGVNAGLALNNFSVIDQNYSLLPYSGTGLGFSASVAYQGKLIKQELGFSFASATLKNNYNYNLNQTYITGNYTNFFSLNKHNLFKILAGPQIALVYAARDYGEYINNNSSFEFATSLNAAVEINYKFSKIGVVLKNKIASPVFSYVQQPAFGFETSFLNANSQNHDIVKNKTDFLGFNKFLRVSNCFIIDKSLAKQHKISLNYNLDFYKINTNRAVKNFTNTITLSYGYLL